MQLFHLDFIRKYTYYLLAITHMNLQLFSSNIPFNHRDMALVCMYNAMYKGMLDIASSNFNEFCVRIRNHGFPNDK